MSAKKPNEDKIANIAPFGLRMLPELKDQVAAAASKNGRSMNAEIVFRLEYSFRLGFATMEGYSFFGEITHDDGLRMSDTLNAELANAAAAKGISIREEIEERLWFSLKPQNEVNERLVDHVLDKDLDLQRVQSSLDEAMRLINLLSPQEKLILEERAEMMESSAPKAYKQKALVEHIENSPITSSTEGEA